MQESHKTFYKRISLSSGFILNILQYSVHFILLVMQFKTQHIYLVSLLFYDGRKNFHQNYVPIHFYFIYISGQDILYIYILYFLYIYILSYVRHAEPIKFSFTIYCACINALMDPQYILV